MPLCFIEPKDSIRVIADSVGRASRRTLVGEVVAAWVDDIPEHELCVHYEKALAGLAEEELHMLAVWHSNLEVGQPIANTDFLVSVFPSLGEHRRGGEPLGPDDLAVTATLRGLHLVHRETGQVIEPQVFHPLDLEKQMPALARFLAHLTLCSKPGSSRYPFATSAVRILRRASKITL